MAFHWDLYGIWARRLVLGWDLSFSFFFTHKQTKSHAPHFIIFCIRLRLSTTSHEYMRLLQ